MFLLSGITKSYGVTRILTGVDLSLEPGQALCVAGANAAGKTTLLTIAASLQKADAGHVRCDGLTGYVPQEPALLDELTVRDNLHLWYAAFGKPKGGVFSKEAPETALGLRSHARKRVSALSGGMKKRVAIAAALTCEPAWLVMDEPFTALDLQSRSEIIELLHSFKAHGCGILFTSHEPSAIAAVADRVALLRGGVLEPPVLLAGGTEERTAQVIQLLSRA